MTAEQQLDVLRPYVPRQVLQWLADEPAAHHREVAGTLVFVDISGFTKLSERLAKQGKVGAEQLTDAIGACFTQLLGVAYGNGGGLLKFGGDALLLLFNGDSHAVRATQAAVGMRRALRAMGAIDCAGVKVALRMSIGVHSGTFQFFLVGAAHRELLITGADATQTVLMEATAEAGEIVLSAATAALLPASVVGSAKGPGFLLRRQPPGLVQWHPEDASALHVPDVSRCIPEQLRELSLAGGVEAEHKLVTVAFLHFDGTDAFIAEHGAAAAAQGLGDLVSDVQRAAARHGVCFLGSDIDKDGGKILLTAGAPTSTGDDEERMLLTLREVLDIDRRVSVRAGVNSGHVFAGEIGPPYRRTYTVMGDAVNLAARVMAKAERGELLATQGVVTQSRTTFVSQPLEPFMVKGKSKPVQALAIGSTSGRRDRDVSTAPFVGRDGELATLLEVLAESRGGHGHLVDVAGEPGIGKTRLITELRARASEFVHLVTACQAYESSTPYYPFRSLLRQVLDIDAVAGDDSAARRLTEVLERLAPELLPWAPLVAVVLDIDVEPTPEVARIDEKFRGVKLQEVVEALLEKALPTPTLIVIEDAHWMDDASAEFVQRLVAGLDSRPWLLCTARRESGTGLIPAPSPAVRRMRLGGLAREPATTMVEALVDGATTSEPLAPHEIAVLVHRADGNPLFLSQLVATVASTGLEALPGSVEGVIVARIDALPSRERALLRQLSVLGSTFDRELAQTVLGADLPGTTSAVWERLAEFLDEDSGALRFRQALVRDGAYEGLPFRTRGRLHGAVAAAIEARAGARREDYAETLSVHYFYAHDFVAALRYSRLAAQQARELYANFDAAGFYERAIEAARRCDDVPAVTLAGLFESLGDVRKRIGEFARASEAYRRARRLVADDALATARVLLKEAGVRKQQSRFPQARRWLRRATATLQSAGSADAARLHAQVAVAYASVAMEEGRYVPLIRASTRAIAVAREADDRDALAHALQLLDVGYVGLGRWDDAVHFEESLALYEELGDLWGQGTVLNNMGAQAYFCGHWREAAHLYARARQAWETVGDAVYAAIATVNEGEILSDQGHLDAAESLFRKAHRVWHAAGDRSAVAFALGNMGRLSARAGRYDEARTLLQQSKAEFTAVGAESEVRDIDSRLVECALLEGALSEGGGVSDALAKALELLDAVELAGPCAAMLLRLAGQAAMALGEHEQARDFLQQSLSVATERRADFDVALALRALARLVESGAVDVEPAEELHTRCQHILDRLGVVSVVEPSGLRPTLVIPEPRVAGTPAPA